MVDSINDIARQARQGSVSAIIQVLNDKLADSGVRTRAVFVDGVLQLLCEAAKPEQLEQSTLVPYVRTILESLRPRNIRRVNINSRIVREQQLLWLEEINRDPENQLLWSEEIVLARPNLLKRITEDWRSDHSSSSKKPLPKTAPARVIREQKLFWRGIIGGASLSLLLLLIGWAVYDWLELGSARPTQATASQAQEELEPEDVEPMPSVAAETVTPAPAASPPAPAAAPPTPASPTSQDPFVQAVRIAEQAVVDGQSAQSSADWLDLASRWQRASDLMGQVAPGDGRYKTAQDRLSVYRRNSETALQEAQKRSQTPPTGSP